MVRVGTHSCSWLIHPHLRRFPHRDASERPCCALANVEDFIVALLYEEVDVDGSNRFSDQRVLSHGRILMTAAHGSHSDQIMHSNHALELLGIAWSDPVPLQGAIRGAAVPALPGLYRIRRVGLPHWDYVGQTGVGRMNLRRRMAMLRGIYADQMPYRDPHTAGPGLWALLGRAASRSRSRSARWTRRRRGGRDWRRSRSQRTARSTGARRRSTSGACRPATACRRATTPG